jgi:hypothetical protein
MNRHIGIDVYAILFQDPLYIFMNSLPVKQSKALEFIVEKNILLYGQRIDKINILMNGHHPPSDGILGIINGIDLVIDGDGTPILGVYTGKNLEECTLTGSVGTYKTVNPATIYIEVYVIQGPYPRKFFRDACAL